MTGVQTCALPIYNPKLNKDIDVSALELHISSLEKAVNYYQEIVFGLVILPLGRDSQASLARWLALAGSVLGFLVTLPLYTGFQAGTAQMQFVEKAPSNR